MRPMIQMFGFENETFGTEPRFPFSAVFWHYRETAIKQNQEERIYIRNRISQQHGWPAALPVYGK